MPHLLYTQPSDDGQIPALLTSGDPYPSDIGDEPPPPLFCPCNDAPDIEEPDPVFDSLKKAERANRDVQQMKMDAPAAAGGTNDKKEKPKRVCGQVSYGDGCIYEVTVNYITADLIGQGLNGCGGPCSQSSIKGLVCTGAVHRFCHSFGARFSAEMFRKGMLAEIEQHLHDCSGSKVWWAATGETIPIQCSPVKAIAGTGPGGECDPAPGDQNAPNQGETYKPSESP